MNMEPMFEVRCDPPYESADGGEGECLNTCTATGLPALLTDLANRNLDRLVPGQVPMMLSIRRLDVVPRWNEAECNAQGHSREDHINPDEVMPVPVDWTDPATRQVNYV